MRAATALCAVSAGALTNTYTSIGFLRGLLLASVGSGLTPPNHHHHHGNNNARSMCTALITASQQQQPHHLPLGQQQQQQQQHQQQQQRSQKQQSHHQKQPHQQQHHHHRFASVSDAGSASCTAVFTRMLSYAVNAEAASSHHLLASLTRKCSLVSTSLHDARFLGCRDNVPSTTALLLGTKETALKRASHRVPKDSIISHFNALLDVTPTTKTLFDDTTSLATAANTTTQSEIKKINDLIRQHSTQVDMLLDSIVRKRKKKMRKHKYRKHRKEQRFLRKKLGK